MGLSVSKIRKMAQDETGQERARMELRCQVLEKMVNARLQAHKSHILTGERGDQEIRSGTIVEAVRQVNIVLSSDRGPELADAIDEFFSGHFMTGLGKLVHLAVNSVLGNSSMGEYETSEMFIVWEQNALLRYDIYCYRWNFATEGVIANTEGVAGVLLCKRVLDITKTDPQVLSWAISHQASALGENDAMKMIDEAMGVLEKVMSFQARVQKIQAESGLAIQLE